VTNFSPSVSVFSCHISLCLNVLRCGKTGHNTKDSVLPSAKIGSDLRECCDEYRLDKKRDVSREGL
jgi:hypothetical protein